MSRAAGDLRLHEIARDVFLYRGYFSNSAVLRGRDGLVIVDTQVSLRAAARLRASLTVCGELPVALVVNTHHHGDHIGGNGLFPEAEILGTADCARYVVQRDAERLQYADTFGLAYQEIPPAIPPTRTFEGAQTFTLGPDRFEILQIGRAETPDACVVTWPARGVVACGDGVATCGYPFLGVPFRDEGLRDDGEWLRFLATIRHMRPQILLPGHGPPIVGEHAIIARVDLLSSLMRDLLAVTKEEMARRGQTTDIVQRVDGRLRRYSRRRDLDQYTVSQQFAILRCVNNLSPQRAGRGWWNDLRPSVMKQASPEEGRRRLAALTPAGGDPGDGHSFARIAACARALARRGNRPEALALVTAYRDREVRKARSGGLLSELLFDGARGVRPTVDATEYVAAALREARTALAIDGDEPRALLTLGCAEVFGGMVLAQPMAPAVAKIMKALSSGVLPEAQRRKGEFFLGKAWQMEGDDDTSDAHFRRALPCWARPLYGLVRTRMRSYP